jgi:thioredoxin:protein disulfide reductase
MTFFKKLTFLLFLIISSHAIAEIHDASKIFQLTTQQTSNQLKLHFEIQDKHFLYRDRIHIQTSNHDVMLGRVQWPSALSHTDKLGHVHAIYRNKLDISVPLNIYHFSPDMKIEINYQGCSDEGICYPPTTHLQILNPPLAKSFILILISFIGLGILLAFTPCVLPMIPIMTRVVIGEHRTKLQTWALSLAYVFGMASSYALVGAIVAHLGKNLLMLTQQKSVLIVMAIFYILFGLATLGIWQIQIPQFLQQKTLKFRSHLPSGKYLSAFIMGAISLLVLSPCVTAPLLGALAYITQMGEILKGSLALFALGLGMGIPLLIFAVSAGHLLPKIGVWMEHIKKIIALLLFGVASLLIQRIVDTPWQMFPWIATVAAALLLFIPHRPYLKFKLSLFILFLLGSMLFFYQQMKDEGAHPSLKNVQEIKERIAQSHKPIIMYFSAKWCTTCHYIEKNVISKEQLKSACDTIDLIRVDISDNTKAQMQILQTFKIVAPPTMVVWDPKTNRIVYQVTGEEITPKQLKRMCQMLR